MKCSLDRTKINTAIENKVSQELQTSFLQEGNVLSPRLGVNAEELVKEINKKYKGNVVTQLQDGNYLLNVTPTATRNYIFSQPDSSEQVIEAIREEYLKQFSTQSVNLLQDDHWLNHPFLEDATTQKLIEFAKKINPEFKIAIAENLDQNAVALIQDHIIMLRESKFIDELPEEVAHFFVALLPDNNELLTGMMKDITNHPIYGETYENYKNNPVYQKDGKPNIDKIKKEAIAKVIAQYVKDAFNGEADQNHKQRRGKLREFVDKVFKFLRKAFYNLSGRLYQEPLIEKDNFKIGADMITNGDISALDLKKVASPYDSLFYSTLEDNKAETHEGSTMAKAFHAFSKGIKITLRKKFFNYIEENKLEGLKAVLSDPKYKNFNRIWDVMHLLSEAEKEFGFLADKENVNLVQIAEILDKLKEAYQEMDQIPIALDKIREQLVAEKKAGKLSESQLVNKITEVQHYLQLSTSFKNLTNQFQAMLNYVKEKEEANSETFPYFRGTYEGLIGNIGSIVVRFNSTDNAIYNILKDYLLDLTDHWTNEQFKKYNDQANDMMEKMEYDKTKLTVFKRLKEHITSKDQLKAALNGEFPKLEEFMDASGKKTKLNLDRIKDVSGTDFMIFYIGATTTMADPFISNAMAFYIDQVFAASRRGMEQKKQLADKMMPFITKLSKFGVDYYAAQRMIQNVQNFFDPIAEDNKFQRRALMSETQRYEFNYEKQKLHEELSNLQKEANSLKIKIGEDDHSDEEKEAFRNKLIEANKNIAAKQKEYDAFIEKYSHRDFTDEFYEKAKYLKPQEGDSTTLKELKKVQSEINAREDNLSELISNVFDPSDLDQIEAQIADLYRNKLDLVSKLGPKEKTNFASYEELYELNKEATDRVVTRHKRAFIQRYVKYQKESKGDSRTFDEIANEAEHAYDFTFKITDPTQEFWDKRNAIVKEITELAGKNNDYSKVLSARQEELNEKRKKILSSIRNIRGEISTAALSTNLPGSNTPLYKELNDIDNELFTIRRKISILSAIQSNVSTVQGISPEDMAKNVTATVDVFTAFEQMFQNNLDTDNIIKNFGHYFTMNKSTAEAIKNLIEKYAEDQSIGDPMQEIVKLLKPLSKEATFALDKLSSVKLLDLVGEGDKLIDIFSQFTRVNKDVKDAINERYSQLDDLGGKQVSIDYIYGPLYKIKHLIGEILGIEDNSLSDKVQDGVDMNLIRAKSTGINGYIRDSNAVDKFLSDGLITNIVKYLRIKAEHNLFKTGEHDYESEKLANFLEGIHYDKVVGQQIVTTPREYFKKYLPSDPSLVNEHYPRYLQRNKVQDKYKTEKIYENDPRVLAKTHKPTVDLNGQWLPKYDKDSKFYNNEYDRMKNSSDTKDQTAFEMLQTFTQDYIQRQIDAGIIEGQRLDLVLPAKLNDKFEKTKLHITSLKEWYNHIVEATRLSGKTENAEAINFNEELGIATKHNREIYSGAIIAEHAVKLDSRRRVPVQRVTEDILSAMMFFIGDVNEYSAKNFVAPIFKSFADTFQRAYEKNPSGNKLRADFFKKLTEYKLYDIKPDNIGNNPVLSRFLQVINSFAVRKLLADPLGAMVNLLGGQLQMLIEHNLDPREIGEWKRTGVQASNWSRIYVGDTFTQQNLSKETQIANAFGMLPEGTDIGHRMSKSAIWADWRKAMMFPRSITEVEMGIHLGLSIAHSFDITHQGKSWKMEDIYTLNKETGLVELIPEFKNDEEMVKKYNIIDGTEVAKIRRMIVQKYTLIQGNFYKFNQDYASTTAIGRSAELMKRWFVSGYIRRWQDRVIDPLTGGERLGFHIATLNLVREAMQALNPFNKEASLGTLGDYWRNGRTSEEKIALRKSLAELMYISLSGLFLVFALGYNDNDKDKGKKLRAMSYWQQILLLIALRADSELGTYIPLPMWGLGLNETKRAFLDPVSTIRGTVDNIVAMSALATYQAQYWLGINTNVKNQLYYQKDQGGKTTGSFLGVPKDMLYLKDKGDSKFFALLMNTLGYTGYTVKPEPYIKTLTQMQNKLK